MLAGRPIAASGNPTELHPAATSRRPGTPPPFPAGPTPDGSSFAAAHGPSVRRPPADPPVSRSEWKRTFRWVRFRYFDHLWIRRAFLQFLFTRARTGRGQYEIKRGSLIYGGVRPHLTAVTLHNPLDNCQTDARPRIFLGSVQALEYSEKLVGITHIEPDAV